jgi:hypothetical protein
MILTVARIWAYGVPPEDPVLRGFASKVKFETKIVRIQALSLQ